MAASCSDLAAEGFVFLENTAVDAASSASTSSGHVAAAASAAGDGPLGFYVASPVANEYPTAVETTATATTALHAASEARMTGSVVSWMEKPTVRHPGLSDGHGEETSLATVYVAELSVGGRKWQIERRFSQFYHLWQWLGRHAPFVLLTPLPGKFGQTWLQSTESLANKRLPPLRSFVEQLVACPPLLQLYEVQDFLGLLPGVGDGQLPDAERLPGVFYVKIVEAVDLPLKRGGMPTCYVRSGQTRTLLDGGDGETVVTRTFGSSTAPKWYEEQVFLMPHRGQPVRLQAVHKRALRSDVLLGAVQVDVRSFTPCTLYDVWLPLGQGHPSAQPASDHDRPQLHVLAHYHPAPVARAAVHRLPAFRLQLQRRKFFPGQVVAGLLVCNVGEPLPAKSVSVQLYGCERTHWTETHTSTTTDAKGNTRTTTHTTHYQQTVVLISETRRAWHASSDHDAGLQSGSYIWPFEFLLPARLPPSFKSQHAWVEYSVRAVIDRPGMLTVNKRVEQPFRLLAPYTSLSPLPQVYGRIDRLPFRSADQVVNIQAHLSHDIAIIGEPTTLTVTVDNQTSKRILDCTVRLRTSIVARAHSRSKHYGFNVNIATLSGGSDWPILSGQARSFAVNFTVPKQAQPTLPADLSPIVQVEHHVDVCCDISGFLTGTASVAVPVILSHRLPSPEQWLAGPPAKPDRQPTIEQIAGLGVALPNFAPVMFSAPAAEPTAPPSEEKPMFDAPPPPTSFFSPDFQPQMPAFAFPPSQCPPPDYYPVQPHVLPDPAYPPTFYPALDS